MTVGSYRAWNTPSSTVKLFTVFIVANSNRDTLIVEDCELTHIACHPDEQYILVTCTANSRACSPGSFVHLTCEPSMAMRRPLSIMRASADGWIEVLFKPVEQAPQRSQLEVSRYAERDRSHGERFHPQR